MKYHHEMQSSVNRAGMGKRGFTLIEMLVVMTLTTVLLGMMLVVCSGIIRRVSQADMHLARMRNVQEAAEAMRGLLNQADTALVEESGRAMAITSGPNASNKARLQLAEKPFRLELTQAGKPGKRVLGLTGLERGQFSMAQVTGGKPVAVLELWLDTSAERRVGRAAADARSLRVESAIGPVKEPLAKGAKP